MNRRAVLDVLFTALIFALVAAAVWDARVWEIKARLFPWAIGFPVLGLLALQLVFGVRRLVGATTAGQVTSAEHEHEIPREVLRRRAATIIGWFLGMMGLIWLLGFAIGGTLGTAIYLRFTGRETWRMTVYMTLGTLIFFWIMIYPLTVPFYEGWLFDQIGFKPTEWLGYHQNILWSGLQESLGLKGR